MLRTSIMKEENVLRLSVKELFNSWINLCMIDFKII